jgi:hypothetical protein
MVEPSATKENIGPGFVAAVHEVPSGLTKTAPAPWLAAKTKLIPS